MYFAYSVMLGTALALSLPYWLVQMARTGKYRAGLGERFGRVPPRVLADRRPCVWVHAVSVGEVLAVSGLIRRLRERFPEHRVVISTTTATGQKLARERFGAENVFYFPLDFAFCIRPWFRALRPELVVLAETEFWPNFLRLARKAAPVAVVNARISDRSLPRYWRVRQVIARVLVNVSIFLAQSDEDRRRLIKIGALPERLMVSGNLKFDVRPAAASGLVEKLRGAMNPRAAEFGVSTLAPRDAGNRSQAGTPAQGWGTHSENFYPVVVCGSTVEGEEALLLPAFRALLERWPAAAIILAPRHPERFDDVARLLAASGFAFQRRSQWNGEPIAGSVFLLDSIGELAATYSLAQVAFVGGSLVPRGGHNVLEAAQAGAAILVGPYTENFRDIIAQFRQAGALRVVTAEEITGAIADLLADEQARHELMRRAGEVLRAHAGATDRTLNALEALLAREVPQ